MKMLKNVLRKQRGLSLLELLIAFAIFVIIIPAVIAFSKTAVSNNTNIANQTTAINQLKFTYDFMSQDIQQAGVVSVPSTTSNFPLTLKWISFPTDPITVVYNILPNGKLQRVYTDTQTSQNNSTIITAANVNIDPNKTYCTWASDNGTDNNVLNVQITITMNGIKDVVRQFGISPRVIQSNQILAVSSLSLTATPNNAMHGTPVILTASVLPSTATGDVIFLDGNNTLGTSHIMSSGQAILTVSSLTGGTHSLTAIYSGDPNDAQSTSPTCSETIFTAAGTVNLSSTTSPWVFGTSPLIFTAAITPNTATGTVTFYNGATQLGSPVAISSGSAIYTSLSTDLAVGNNTISAVYSGDSYVTGATGYLSQLVWNPAPGTTINISPSSCNAGAPSPITLTVNGTGFVSSSTVNFSGIGLTTAYVSPSQLTAVVPITSLTTAGQFPVTVTNPLPGGGISNNVNFLVIGSANAGHSTLSENPSPANNILADGVTVATLIVTAKDSAGNLVGTGGATVVFNCSSGTASLGAVTDVGNGTYTSAVVSTSLGTCTFTATINSGNVGGGASVQATFVAGNTINVNSTTLWSALTGGTGIGGKPSAADTIIIGSNKTLTVDVSTAVANSVTLGTGNGSGLQGQLTFNSGSQLVVGTLSRNSNQVCNVTMTSGGILVVTTSWVAGLTLIQGTGSINFGGAASQILPSNITIYNNLATVGSVTASIGANTTVNGTLTVSDGTSLSLGAYTVTVTGATTIGNGTSGTLTISSATGTKTFAGLVTIKSGATWNNSANEAVTFKGGITCNGTFTAGSAVQTFNTNAQAIVGNLSIPSITVTGITLTNTGTLTVTSALAGTGTLLNAATGTLNLNISVAVGITTLTANVAGNTVNYGYNGNQTVKAVAYYYLVLSGTNATNTKTLPSGTSVTKNLSIASTGNAIASIGAGLNLAVNSLTLGGISGQAIGTWGSTSSSAAHKNNTYFASTGVITVAALN